MIENLPDYILIVFIATAFTTVGIFLYALNSSFKISNFSKVIALLVPLWMILQAFVAHGGFYLSIDSKPPRMLLFGVLPPLFLIAAAFAFARKSIVDNLSLKILTVIQIVRIPVEVVLFWLFRQKLVPQLMTFDGRNFDILAGISAPLIFWLAFRKGSLNRSLLIVWNICALGLLFNIVINAVLSFPFPIQQFGLEQPNRALLYFPFVWLPVLIVPIVFFCHLASLWKLFAAAKD